MSLSERLARASEVAAELAAAVADELNDSADETVDAAVLEAWRVLDSLTLSVTEIVGEWNSRALFTRDGSLAPGARLARDTGCRKATADRVVRRSRFLRAHPKSLEAARNGHLVPDQADSLTRAAIAERERLFTEAEDQLLSDAKRLGGDDFDRVTRYWSDAADDFLGRDRSKGQSEVRRLTMAQTLNGSWHIEGLLDPVAGSIVANEIDRIAQEMWDDDWASSKERFGDVVTEDALGRTPPQRRADALVRMATRSTAMPDGSKPARPLFTVEVDKSTALRICQLANGTVVTRGMLSPWFLEADFERIIFDTPSRVIDISQRSRFFRGALRRAIEVRDKHCTFPGCTVEASKCDVDHIVEYGHGGLTTQANGRLRCPRHNRQRPGRLVEARE